VRLIFFNILDGADGEPDRLERILRWLRDRRADVVGLAECNGWHADDVFNERRERAGYGYGKLLAGGSSPYHLAVLAREPVECVAKVTEGFHHGLLHVRTSGIDVICTHFSPDSADRRAEEAERSADRMAGVSGPAVLMGDLNSLSPVDRELAGEFLSADDDWATDTRPHESLRGRGLIDLGETVPVLERWTTATALNPDEPKRRLDFIYANDAMRHRFPEMVARPVRDDVTASLSDHFPLVAEPADGGSD
jgi:endonuclease/exonuclease/phosphatase family metal-dependent hydrolase